MEMHPWQSELDKVIKRMSTQHLGEVYFANRTITQLGKIEMSPKKGG
jgi:hypothetical protein